MVYPLYAGILALVLQQPCWREQQGIEDLVLEGGVLVQKGKASERSKLYEE